MLYKISQYLGLEKELIQNIFVLWAGKVSNYLTPFLLIVIFFRNLPESQSFLFTVIITFISFYNLGSDFGLAEVAQKFLLTLPTPRVMSSSIFLNFILNSILCFILLLIQVKTNFFEDYFWLLILTTQASIFNLLALAFSGQLKLFTSGIYIILSNLGFIAITSVAYLFSRNPIFSLLFGRFLSWTIPNGLILFQFYKKKYLSLQLKPTRRITSFWYSVVVLLFSDLLISFSDLILNSYFRGIKAATSFGVVNFFGSTPSLVGILIFTPALPILSYLFKNKPSQRIGRLVLNIFFITCVLVLITFLFSFFIGIKVIPLFTGISLNADRLYLVFVLKLLADSVFTLGLPFLAYLLARERVVLVRNISFVKIFIYIVFISISVSNFHPAIPPLAALVVYLTALSGYLFYFLKDQDWADDFSKLTLNEDGSLPMKEVLTKNKYKLINPVDFFSEQKIEHFFILKLPPKSFGGNHYHKFSKRWLLVLSSRARIVLEDIESKQQQIFEIDSEKENKLILMNTYHAVRFENLSKDQELMLFVLTDKKYNPKKPDTFDYSVKN
jgi:O-antigen/teichoic acid export membrane protein